MIGSRIKMHQNDIEWIEHRVKQSRSNKFNSSTLSSSPVREALDQDPW